ncbi:hypothetical protein C4M97_00450 [Mycoplasmopsis pullorum]|uniref:hypothetical protein n=2 Tax=Mycoplasmopsis pullorum TaxID=48003 RepID=UPI00111858E1|nr:hypothetical protein [Mycoplasmopsis pullorum]TNK81556.1 hypothetical protein C4M94_03810 [Mycoplasmopsis pullorum]TNK82450.1 hypothetical protein C4M80_02990 [Mycoplasmopsis pullorum]TNK84077.1 hypothetical protein C4M81_03400 [Mycoplasmopsis pullorum]TNK84587.1 hypothetical protein C4M92_03180 [Mycoplasmopsis pullorum]TNK86146.1 hypothetical protein C4M85_00970 [Mycoplasmopsis pullorum]
MLDKEKIKLFIRDLNDEINIDIFTKFILRHNHEWAKIHSILFKKTLRNFLNHLQTIITDQEFESFCDFKNTIFELIVEVSNQNINSDTKNLEQNSIEKLDYLLTKKGYQLHQIIKSKTQLIDWIKAAESYILYDFLIKFTKDLIFELKQEFIE